ncbi:glutamate--tRNA ligase [Candidatus Berkelbacteria bacterium]|nr:glutamate--tRNA ligase [Candidatus Berkelbacteria bacterium]
MKKVRVRFAPSPTGELHLGGARTALYDYLVARNLGGQFVLRIEDTDQERYVEGSMERFLADLDWLGLAPDEGPVQGGGFEPYIQSERLESHQKIAQELLEKGLAYYDFSTSAGSGGFEDEAYRAGRVIYRGEDRNLNLEVARERLANGETAVIRLKVPAGKIEFNDLVRGKVTFDLATVDDAVLLKSDGYPTYHLANVVDDYLMEISHVLRAEEWLPSTPKHLVLYDGLGWPRPEFAHLPLILATDKKKLSKRVHGEGVWIGTYRDQGYLPEAIVNYLALLGWNAGGDQEFFSLDELVAKFSLDRVHKAGAVFDPIKLDHFQNHYIKQLTVDDLAKRLEYFISSDLDRDLVRRVATVVQNRLVRLADFESSSHYFFELPEYEKEDLVFKKSTAESSLMGLDFAHQALFSLDEAGWQIEETLNSLLGEVRDHKNLTNGDLFWPIRVALTGQQKSPSPSECLWVLGKDESLKRLTLAKDKLGQ